MATFGFTLTDEQKAALLLGVASRWEKPVEDPPTDEEWAQTNVKDLLNKMFINGDLVTVLRCPAALVDNLIEAVLAVRPMTPEFVAAGGESEEWTRLTIQQICVGWYASARERRATGLAPDPETDPDAVEHM